MFDSLMLQQNTQLAELVVKWKEFGSKTVLICNFVDLDSETKMGYYLRE